MEQLIAAINFAAIKHADQRRSDPSQTPYINHPIGVMHILCNEANVCDLDVLKVQCKKGPPREYLLFSRFSALGGCFA